jgi:hypothetical protein
MNVFDRKAMDEQMFEILQSELDEGVLQAMGGGICMSISDGKVIW